MNLLRDLEKIKKQRQLKDSAVAQLRKRSKDSLARPKATKNIFSKKLHSINTLKSIYYAKTQFMETK